MKEKIKKRKLYLDEQLPVCFFRNTLEPPYRKALLQITERCNFRCEHCFVSAEQQGEEMDFAQIKDHVIPYFLRNNVVQVTLTGGEPLCHKKFDEIVTAFTQKNIRLTICSNGYALHEGWIKQLSCNPLVLFNVSMDGFSAKSYGKFRGEGNLDLFPKAIENIKLLAKFKLLKGILCTPNNYSSVEEYVQLCEFAKSIGASYVLMNPLSELGRGATSKHLVFTREGLTEIQNATKSLQSENFQLSYIRFPSIGTCENQCHYGEVLYVFTNGDISVCPYMTFATDNEKSRYSSEDFRLCNIFTDENGLDYLLDEYRLPDAEEEDKILHRGCLACKIAQGQELSGWDLEMFPNKEVSVCTTKDKF